MVIYLGIGALVSFILPFPIGLGVMLIVIFSINIVRAEIRLRKTGVGGIKGWTSHSLRQHLDTVVVTAIYTLP